VGWPRCKNGTSYPKEGTRKLFLEEEGQWVDHETDGKMTYRRMQPSCSGFGTGRLQQEGRRLGRPWPKNGPSAIEEEEEVKVQ
jgi:hypothetical protein